MHGIVCAIVLTLLAPLAAQAASFQVNPIRVTLSAGHGTEVLHVTNSSATPTVVQLQIMAWAQDHNQDVYTPSRDLLATPPIFTVGPGGEQVVRIGMRTAPDARRETDYRLFLTEVPPAPTPGFRGVQIALRVGIPVFVEPAVPGPASLQWSARRVSERELEISADNTGNAHVEILNLKLALPGESQPLAQQFGGYVLPGARRSWNLPLAKPLAANTSVEIDAETDRGNLHARLKPGS